jgi:hypothetical protein
VAGANPNPSPDGNGQPATGQNPNIACQNFTVTPGANSSSTSSPFSGGHSTTVYAGNGTTGNVKSQSGNAVSEYDIACYQQTEHSLGNHGPFPPKP